MFPWKFDQNNLHTAFSRVLGGRYTIGIRRDHNESIKRRPVSIGGNIQSYAHINAFLFEIGFEVIVCQCICGDRNMSRHKASKFQYAQTNRE